MMAMRILSACAICAVLSCGVAHAADPGLVLLVESKWTATELGTGLDELTPDKIAELSQCEYVNIEFHAKGEKGIEELDLGNGGVSTTDYAFTSTTQHDGASSVALFYHEGDKKPLKTASIIKGGAVMDIP